jgi:hypothetical protein
MTKNSFAICGWSMYRVIVQSNTTGQWYVWAAFAVENEAHIFCEQLDKSHNDWNARVLHPDSKMPKRPTKIKA